MRASGLKLGCVTNKPLRFAEPLLARFALLELFDALVAGDSAAAKKPDPAPVLEACRRLGVPPRVAGWSVVLRTKPTPPARPAVVLFPALTDTAGAKAPVAGPPGQRPEARP